jgi:hypothetical protein
MLNYPLFSSFGGSVKKVRRLIDPEVQTWSATNPSIAYSSEGGLVMAIRSSNYVLDPRTAEYTVTTGDKIKNKVYFCELNSDLGIENLREIKFDSIPLADEDLRVVRGAEDAKLFWRNGAWHFTAVMKEPYGIPIPRMAKFIIKNDVAHFLDLNGFINEDNKKAEKNWMSPYNENPNFDYVYGPDKIVKDRELITVRDINEETSGLRGGSNLWDLGDETYLAIVHKTYIKKTEYFSSRRFGVVQAEIRNYEHRFARYDNQGRLFQLSPPFQFIGPGVEFAAGLVVLGEQVVVSFGKNDMASYLASIELSTTMSILRDV